MMTRTQVAVWGTLSLLAGSGLLAYLLFYVPPKLDNGELNMPALLLFWIGLLFTVGGASSLVALALHNRWPVLAGVRSSRVRPNPAIAFRQGVLMALATGVLAILALLQMLDIVFIIVTFVLAGLLETFLQSRRR